MDRWDRRFWLLNVAFLFLRLIAAATLPLSPDESYYWLWSRALDCGYFDHPPMVAWWIAASTSILGDSPLGIRFFAPLSLACLAALGFWLARREMGGRAAFQFALAIHLIPLTHLGGIILTPDTPFLLFWSLALLALAAYRSHPTTLWVGLIGLCVGLGLLSKLSMGLMLPIVFLGMRHHGRRPFLALSLALGAAGMVILPWLAWNVGHDWVSVTFQWGHATSGSGRWLANASGFIAAQLFLFTPGLWWWFWRARKTADLWCLAAWGPFLMVLFFGIFSHAEAGWAAMAYPAALWLAWRGVARSGGKAWRGWRKSLVIAGVFTGLLYLWAFGALGDNPVLGQIEDLKMEQARFFDHSPTQFLDLPLVAQHYRLASMSAYLLRDARVTPGVLSLKNQRRSQFDLWPAPSLERGFIWIAEARIDEPPALANYRDFDCRYADEYQPDMSQGRFLFLVCVPH